MKKNMMKIAAVAAVLVFGAVVYMTNFAGGNDAGSAHAETSEANKEAWFIRCSGETPAEELETKRGACEMVQRQSMAETGQRVMEFAIGYPADAETARGVLILPLGIFLPAGAQMQVDDGETFTFQIRTCVPGGCIANLTFTEEVLEIFKSGKTATVTMAQDAEKTVSLEIPLNGFAKSLDDIRS